MHLLPDLLTLCFLQASLTLAMPMIDSALGKTHLMERNLTSRGVPGCDTIWRSGMSDLYELGNGGFDGCKPYTDRVPHNGRDPVLYGGPCYSGLS